MGIFLRLRSGGRELDLNSGDYCLDKDFQAPFASPHYVLSESIDGAEFIGSHQRLESMRFQVNITGSNIHEVERRIKELGTFLGRAEDREDPLVLLYRAYDDPVNEPYYGQFDSYERIRVVHGDIQVVRTPHAQHTGFLAMVQVSLTVNPQRATQPLRLWQAFGNIQQSAQGIMIPSSGGNQYQDPFIASGTTGAYGGTSDYVRVTSDPDKVLFGYYALEARVGSNETLVEPSMAHFLSDDFRSVYIKKQDGTAVTSGDVVLLRNTTEIIPTYVDVGNGWYWLCGVGGSTGGSVDEGVKFIRAGVYYADGFFYGRDEHQRAFHGSDLGATWTSGVFGSVSTGQNAEMFINRADLLGNEPEHMIRLIWQPTSTGLVGTTDRGVLLDSDDPVSGFQLWWESSPLTLNLRLSTNDSIQTSGITWDPATPMVIHARVSKDSGKAELYLDGIQLAGATLTPSSAKIGGPTVNYYLGSDHDGLQHSGGIFKGISTLPYQTSGDVLGDYNRIAPIVDSRTQTESIPYYWLPTTGFGATIHNNNTTDGRNYMVVGGILGDDSIATIDLEIASSTGGSVSLATIDALHTGRFKADYYRFNRLAFDPSTGGAAEVFYVTPVTGTSGSGFHGGWASLASSGIGVTSTGWVELAATDASEINWDMIAGETWYGYAILRESSGNAGTKPRLRLKLKFGTNGIVSTARTVATSGTFTQYTFGGLNAPNPERFDDYRINASFALEAVRDNEGTSGQIRVDAVYFAPDLTMLDGRASGVYTSLDGLILRDREVWAYASTGSGDLNARIPSMALPIRFVPGRFQIVSWNWGEAGKLSNPQVTGRTLEIQKIEVQPLWYN